MNSTENNSKTNKSHKNEFKNQKLFKISQIKNVSQKYSLFLNCDFKF